MLTTRRLLFNAISFLPGATRISPIARRIARRTTGTGGTNSARYCYSVWLRHLVMTARDGLNSAPDVVAELGPGDSLGIGLSALLSGANRYVALDVVRHADASRNLQVFGDLVDLFRRREPIPDAQEFPRVGPRLSSYAFPSDVLDATRLDASLAPERIARIEASIRDTESARSMIRYRAPWRDVKTIEAASIDMILSQAVLEHVDDLAGAYHAMRLWLRPGGIMSHEIDFCSHGFAEPWNGHWRYSNAMWKLIRGKDPWCINREPWSTHLALLADENCRVVAVQRMTEHTGLARARLARRFRTMSDEDLTTRTLFFQAQTS